MKKIALKSQVAFKTESYSDMFWRHGKQLLKGALLLGGGYIVWKNFGAQSPTTNNPIANLPTKLTPLTNDILQIPIIDFNNDNNYSEFANSIFQFNSHNKRRTSNTTQQCIPYWQEFPSQAQIAGDSFSNGGYVIAWTGTDGYIYAQRYNVDGSVLGNELSVSDNQANVNYPPVVKVLSNDNFVVAWTITSILNSPNLDIYCQIYDPFGNILQNQFQVIPYDVDTGAGLDFPSIATLPDGSFVMAFTQDVYSTYYLTSIHYSTLGNWLSSSQADNPNTGGVTRYYVAASGLPNGNFTATWLGYDQTFNYGIFTIVSNPDVFYSWSFYLPATNNISIPVLTGLQNGNFVIAWISGQNVYAQLLSQTLYGGTPYPATLGNSIIVNTSPGSKSNLGISTLANGEFIIAWQSRGDVYIQRYLSTAMQKGPAILLFNIPTNTYADTSIYTPMFGLPNNDFFVLSQNWAQRVYGKLTIANACSQSYTENIPQLLGLTVSALSYIFNQTTIAVQLQNTVAGQLKSLQTVSGSASASYNATSGIWFEIGANVADLNAVLSTLQFVPALNYNDNVTININAQDNLGNTFQSSYTLQGISVNYPPSWVNNQMVINQGQTLTLSKSNLQIYDLGKMDNAIEINVISTLNGQFEWVTQAGNAITVFTQQDVDNALVAFAHNGLSLAPSYALTATDGVYTTQVSTGNVNFDLTPEIFVNVLTINSKGQTITLTSSQILAVDNNDLPNQLIFTANNIQHGHFEISTNPGKTTTTFSQLFIDSGLVKFIHDGSDQSPGYTLTVNDGRITSEPSDAVVAFNIPTSIPFTETTGFKAGISVLSIAASTMIGFATWRYRNHIDAERRREKYPIAKKVREQMHISGIANFEAGDGVQFKYLIKKILEELTHQEMDYKTFTDAEQVSLAVAIAQALKPYTTKTIPAKKLTGTNTITHYYNNVYYSKIKPMRKSDITWLNIDEAKKVTDQIATDAKKEWDNPTVKVSTGIDDVEMQSLRK